MPSNEYLSEQLSTTLFGLQSSFDGAVSFSYQFGHSKTQTERFKKSNNGDTK